MGHQEEAGAGLGRRRSLSRRETALWYGVAAVSYIAASIVFKGLSNWLIGPAWLVAVVVVGPMFTDRLRARGEQA